MLKDNGKILILASASPRRSLLMKEAGYAFEVHPSDAREISGIAPRELVKKNAELKASAVAQKYPLRTVIGADTIVALGNETFGKPRDIEDAKRMLRLLSGKTHSVFTAVAIVKNDGAKVNIKSAVDESRVKFRELSDAEIQNYISKVDVLDKAGAYAAQECGESIIERIDGEFDNVMGLPMKTVKKLLAEADF